METNFFGKDGFVWFIGVVEDRQDPLQLGRIRVRALGWHTEDKALIPTENLPWANVMQPITSGAMNGIGVTPIGPVPGTWVVGWFSDGESGQVPIIMGTIAGIPEELDDNSTGFFDPRDNPNLIEKLANAPRKIKTRTYHNDGSGVTLTPENAAQNYPREINPLGCVINEPDVNRLARNANINDTIIGTRDNNTDLNIPIAFGGTYDEPKSTYDAVYPYNHVTETESGHVVEMDDTPGAERTHYWDRSGSFEETQDDGTTIRKVVGDGYEIIMKGQNIHIMGKLRETVQQDANLLFQQRLNVEVDGNVNLLVKGGIFVQVDGELDFTVGGSVNIKSAGDINMDAPHIWLNSGKANPKTPEQ